MVACYTVGDFKLTEPLYTCLTT